MKIVLLLFILALTGCESFTVSGSVLTDYGTVRITPEGAEIQLDGKQVVDLRKK